MYSRQCCLPTHKCAGSSGMLILPVAPIARWDDLVPPTKSRRLHFFWPQTNHRSGPAPVWWSMVAEPRINLHSATPQLPAAVANWKRGEELPVVVLVAIDAAAEFLLLQPAWRFSRLAASCAFNEPFGFAL